MDVRDKDKRKTYKDYYKYSNGDYKEYSLEALEEVVENEPGNKIARYYKDLRQKQLDEMYDKYNKMREHKQNNLYARTMNYSMAIYGAKQYIQMIIDLREARKTQNNEEVVKHLKRLHKQVDYLSSIIE